MELNSELPQVIKADRPLAIIVRVQKIIEIPVYIEITKRMDPPNKEGAVMEKFLKTLWKNEKT